MKEQFVTYEIALALKELGFDEPCMAYWRDGINDLQPVLLSNFVLDHSRTVSYRQIKKSIEIVAPLWQQVIDWFRNTRNIHIEIRDYQEYKVDNYAYRLVFLKDSTYRNKAVEKVGMIINQVYYFTYEKAREQAIIEVIELLKQQNEYDYEG